MHSSAYREDSDKRRDIHTTTTTSDAILSTTAKSKLAARKQ
jgi:hypothetical protein